MIFNSTLPNLSPNRFQRRVIQRHEYYSLFIARKLNGL